MSFVFWPPVNAFSSDFGLKYKEQETYVLLGPLLTLAVKNSWNRSGSNANHRCNFKSLTSSARHEEKRYLLATCGIVVEVDVDIFRGIATEWTHQDELSWEIFWTIRTKTICIYNCLKLTAISLPNFFDFITKIRGFLAILHFDGFWREFSWFLRIFGFAEFFRVSDFWIFWFFRSVFFQYLRGNCTTKIRQTKYEFVSRFFSKRFEIENYFVFTEFCAK